MNSSQELNIIINAQDKTASGFNAVQSGISTFKDKIEGLKPTFTKMAAVGTAAFVGIGAVALKSIDAYGEAERAARQLEHAVIDVSKGTEEQVKQIDAVAQALQNKVGVDGDSLKMGAAQLSTFGLQAASVVKLTKTLADFTVNQDGLNASSEQYVANANTIAKALNGQFGILEKSGIRFTEAQQKLIQYGTETEKVAALQEGLNQNLRETTDTVDGVDVATAKLKRSVGEIQESIGKALAPAFEKISATLKPILDRFAEWAEKNPELLAKIIMVAGAIAGLVAVLGTLGLILGPISAAIAFLASPITLIIALILVIAYVVYEMIKNWEGVKMFFNDLWESVKATFESVINAIVGIINKFLTAVKTVWTNTWTAIKDFFKSIWDSILGVAESAVNAIKNFLQPIIDMINKVIGGLSSIGKAVGGGISSAVNWVGNKLGINDGIVQNGQIITTHPDDYIIATKNPASLGGGSISLTFSDNTFLSEDVALRIGDMMITRLKQELRF